MIKLIASDVDGTLVKDSAPTVYPEMIEAIHKMKDRGILFCVASGRQYESLRKMFAEVEEDIVFIADNGAHIRYQNQNLELTEMKREYVTDIIQMIREAGDDIDYVVSTNDGCILDTKNQQFLDLMQYGYRNKFRVVEDVLKEDFPIIKIASYRQGSIRELGEKIFIPMWKDKTKTTLAGEEWVDFMKIGVDKGNALAFIQKYFKIKREETVSFGDNSNDIGLMKAAGTSYAVENAVEEVKKAATNICPGYDKKGVYKVISKLLEDE